MQAPGGEVSLSCQQLTLGNGLGVAGGAIAVAIFLARSSCGCLVLSQGLLWQVWQWIGP